MTKRTRPSAAGAGTSVEGGRERDPKRHAESEGPCGEVGVSEGGGGAGQWWTPSPNIHMIQTQTHSSRPESRRWFLLCWPLVGSLAIRTNASGDGYSTMATES